uniref:Alkylated DNA repair protein AlkB homologue 8 N-terminal domain-containing protein n=1 Tax=Knipowitschia caucasica TaxID=637954 RepID=A0AAV2L3M4_KNICA
MSSSAESDPPEVAVEDVPVNETDQSKSESNLPDPVDPPVERGELTIMSEEHPPVAEALQELEAEVPELVQSQLPEGDIGPRQLLQTPLANCGRAVHYFDLPKYTENWPGSYSGWRANHDSVKLIKFADDTTLIGLISNNDESAYRREVDRLVSWCSGNNLELYAQKTVEMIVDFRKSTVPPPPPSVMDSPITSVESFRFLGTTITQDLKWEPTISSLIKKAQQRMYFLRQLRKAKLPAQMLVQFYTAIIESILTSSITVWFAGATVRDKQRLQRIVRSAEEVIGRSLPSLQDLLYVGQCRRRGVRCHAVPDLSPRCDCISLFFS